MSTGVAPYPPVDGTQPCTGEDPELFFLTSSSLDNQYKLDRAVETCRSCPFQRPCLAYALTHGVTGVWGGTTGPQRAALRKQHHIVAVPVDLSDSALARIDIDQFDRGGGFRPRRRRPHRRDPQNSPAAPSRPKE